MEQNTATISQESLLNLIFSQTTSIPLAKMLPHFGGSEQTLQASIDAYNAHFSHAGKELHIQHIFDGARTVPQVCLVHRPPEGTPADRAPADPGALTKKQVHDLMTLYQLICSRAPDGFCSLDEATEYLETTMPFVQGGYLALLPENRVVIGGVGLVEFGQQLLDDIEDLEERGACMTCLKLMVYAPNCKHCQHPICDQCRASLSNTNICPICRNSDWF